jgi:hypothetical protein
MLLKGAGATLPDVIGTLRWAGWITVAASAVCLFQAGRFISRQGTRQSSPSSSMTAA